MAWFTGRFMAGEVAAVLSAFALGYLLQNRSHHETVASQPVQHYGYDKSRSVQGNKEDRDKLPSCPYEYLLGIYGRHHFAPFIKAFRPALKEEDPEKYALILDIMDAVHFCLILVDDICDDSSKRKNQTTAHLIYGSCETANRAYFVLTKMINRAMRERPVLGVELLKALEQMLEGQDLSLVWRRDGLESFGYSEEERVPMYKHMAQLKTGTLFVLLGRLLNDGGDQLDDLFVRFGYGQMLPVSLVAHQANGSRGGSWYAQLQNDCKNIYSDEYAVNKGGVAEDLRNGELSFPIVIALNDKQTQSRVQEAFRSHNEGDIEKALAGLQAPSVKKKCLEALQDAGQGLDKLVAVWGRQEHMSKAA
ncbi:prenyl transferase [Metarhizium album ARSEF 1941]|uniref:Prenyl transferase n=1 Tax=Metarhizium album (strain ARSEF 1941) TaxID=1081103 RepID=A0A0B2WKJ4_METAS|nr:prenyl transferase [Metarhizium album ARSEF 1941]KHN94002.1 prenyl transferase [Metarhizium album ARSEF 1941]